MSKERKLLLAGCSALCLVSAVILLVFISNQSSLSLAYVILVVFNIMGYILNGISYYLLYRQTLKIKELETEMAGYVGGVVQAVRENRAELLEEVKGLPSQRLREDTVLQSMLSDHISSVNTALMVTSIVVALITIAIPLMNYGLVTRDQMEQMDSRMTDKIGEIDDRVNEKLSEADQRIQAFDSKTAAMQQTTRHIETILELMDQSGPEKIVTLEEYLKSYPLDTEMRCTLMTACYGEKDYAGTIENARAIINQEGVSDEYRIIAYRNLANAEYCIGNYQQAIEDYHYGIQRSNLIAFNYYWSGVCYERLENEEKALECYTGSIRGGTESDCYVRRGDIYYNRGEYERAESDYRAYIESGKADKAVKEKLADTLERLGEYEEAAAIRSNMEETQEVAIPE